MSGALDLDDLTAYRRWRERKLDSAPRRIEDILVELGDPRALTSRERSALVEHCATANMAIYASNTAGVEDKELPRRLGAQLGMHRLDSHWLADEDAISPISVRGAADRGERRDFIPYTDKPIKWHTDGYYNPADRTVRGMILHCVQSAESGGENRLLDHEIAYILLRDDNPDHVRVLSEPGVMTIPARVDDSGVARAAQTGPVFSVDGEGFLHMRYTARAISIDWRRDAATQAAIEALRRILAAPTPWILRGRLEPGMGLVCNNVLHDRAGFVDGPRHRRLLYRARYHQRIEAPKGQVLT